MSKEDFWLGRAYQKYIESPLLGVPTARSPSTSKIDGEPGGDAGFLIILALLGFPVLVELLVVATTAYGLVSTDGAYWTKYGLPSLGLHPVLGTVAAVVSAVFWKALHRAKPLALLLLVVGTITHVVVVFSLENESWLRLTPWQLIESPGKALHTVVRAKAKLSWGWSVATFVFSILGRGILTSWSKWSGSELRHQHRSRFVSALGTLLRECIVMLLLVGIAVLLFRACSGSIGR